MTKIKCEITGKEFKITLNPILTVIKCPECKLFMEFSYSYIGLSDSIGVENEDGLHTIIYEKRSY